MESCICIKCRHSLKLNAKFCDECGEKQPEQSQQNKKSDFSASLGDRNVITGSTIVGKSEEITISGPATINNFYVDKTNEHIDLNIFARTLEIDKPKQAQLEKEAKEHRAGADLNDIGGNSAELSGFYKIRFNRAVSLVFKSNDLSSAISLLSTIHKENIYHDETAWLYFLVKAIHKPQDYINDYEKEGLHTIDEFWENFWAFVPYIINGRLENGFKIISSNKVQFSHFKNEILLSEVLACVISFSKTREPEYFAEAKSINAAIGRNLKHALLNLHEFIGKLLNCNDVELQTIPSDFNEHQRFYYQNFVCVNQAHLASQPQINNNTTADFVGQDSAPEAIAVITTPIKVDEYGNSWVDKASGLKFITRNNSLVFHDLRSGKDYPTFLTDRAVWLKKSINPNIDIKSSGLNSSSPNNFGLAFDKYIPDGWLIPTELDWFIMKAFFVIQNCENKYNIKGINIQDDICFLGDELICTDSTHSRVIHGGEKFILAGFSSDKISLYSPKNKSILMNQNQAIYVSKDRFKLSKRLPHHNNYCTTELYHRNQIFSRAYFNYRSEFGSLESTPKSFVDEHYTYNFQNLFFNEGLYLTRISKCEFIFNKIFYNGNFKTFGNRIFFPYNKRLIQNLMSLPIKLPFNTDYVVRIFE